MEIAGKIANYLGNRYPTQMAEMGMTIRQYPDILWAAPLAAATLVGIQGFRHARRENAAGTVAAAAATVAYLVRAVSGLEAANNLRNRAEVSEQELARITAIAREALAKRKL